jgi:hypothetical protein
VENHIEFLEQNDDILYQRQYFQDPNARNQVFSHLNDERQDNEPLYDDYTLQSENDEEAYDVLDTFESEVSCQTVTFLESMHLILDMDDQECKQVVVSSFQNDLEPEDIAQEKSKVKDEASFSPFAHQPKVHTHVFQDPFTNLLETLVKGDFILSMDYGCQFQVEFELLALKLFFLFNKNEGRKKSSSHLLVWLH